MRKKCLRTGCESTPLNDGGSQGSYCATHAIEELRAWEKSYHTHLANREETLRDEFAKAALQAILALGEGVVAFSKIAEAAYEVADEMLRVRKPAAPPAAPLPDDACSCGKGIRSSEHEYACQSEGAKRERAAKERP